MLVGIFLATLGTWQVIQLGGPLAGAAVMYSPGWLLLVMLRRR
jgi:hypothetical protein